jgi:hypothetical protein
MTKLSKHYIRRAYSSYEAAQADARGQRLLTTAQHLTVPEGALLAIVTVEGSAAAERWRDDGVAPTATAGMPISSGQWPPFVYSANIDQISFIASAGTLTLNVSYYALGIYAAL